MQEMTGLHHPKSSIYQPTFSCPIVRPPLLHYSRFFKSLLFSSAVLRMPGEMKSGRGSTLDLFFQEQSCQWWIECYLVERVVEMMQRRKMETGLAWLLHTCCSAAAIKFWFCTLPAKATNLMQDQNVWSRAPNAMMVKNVFAKSLLAAVVKLSSRRSFTSIVLATIMHRPPVQNWWRRA